MKVRAVKTRAFIPPKDNVTGEIFRILKVIPDRSIIAITSKVVSIEEGRCVPVASIADKDTLIQREAEFYLPRSAVPEGYVMHTLTESILMPTAGIDQSNGNGHYILWPTHPYRSALRYWKALKRNYRVKNLGIIIVDSRSMPLRRGVVGFALAYHGFSPLNNYRGRKDVFGDMLSVSQSNIADGLASTAVAVMGEGNERMPLAVITDAPFVRFGTFSKKRRSHDSFVVPLAQDLYAPFLKNVPWRKGGAVDKSKKPLIPLKKTQ